MKRKRRRRGRGYNVIVPPYSLTTKHGASISSKSGTSISVPTDCNINDKAMNIDSSGDHNF
jgi:hypothetical protein